MKTFIRVIHSQVGPRKNKSRLQRYAASTTSSRSNNGKRAIRQLSQNTTIRKLDVHSMTVANPSFNNMTTTSMLSQRKRIECAASVEPPTTEQLRSVFTSSAVPMIGFGFMDNFIMIQAGGYIDATLGVKMGLATLTAAAMGQVVSDVSGVLCGGALERSLHNMGIARPPQLSHLQKQLPLTRNISMMGAVLGVVVGCVLGASSLLLLDLEGAEKAKRADEFNSLLTSMMTSVADELDFSSCTVYLTDDELVTDKKDAAVHVMALSKAEMNSPVVRCAEEGISWNMEHSTDNSKLCMPVLSDQNKVLAVIEFANKKTSGMTDGFSSDDAKLAKLVARHVAILFKSERC